MDIGRVETVDLIALHPGQGESGPTCAVAAPAPYAPWAKRALVAAATLWSGSGGFATKAFVLSCRVMCEEMTGNSHGSDAAFAPSPVAPMSQLVVGVGEGLEKEAVIDT